jgi:hypothetical protein
MANNMINKAILKKTLGQLVAEIAQRNAQVAAWMQSIAAETYGNGWSFGFSDGTVRDVLAVLARPKVGDTPLMDFGYEALWFGVASTVTKPASTATKNDLIPPLALALAEKTGQADVTRDDLATIVQILDEARGEGWMSPGCRAAADRLMTVSRQRQARLDGTPKAPTP